MSHSPVQSAADRAPSLAEDNLGRVAQIDRSLRVPVTLYTVFSVLWLVVGSLLALIAALKLHIPDFLNVEVLTYGRVRALQLNTLGYGWAANAIFAVTLWMMHRLGRVELRQVWVAVLGGLGWNAALTYGVLAVAAGRTTGVEWLEMPKEVAPVLAVSFLLISLWSVVAFSRRQTPHVFVSQWYVLAATFWLPVLYLVAQITILWFPARGTVQAIAGGWYVHGMTGLFLVPAGIAALYYFIPKILGRPIHSYYLAVVGFWTFALFNGWAGLEQLIGGPVPVWLQSTSIVASVMMLIPVLVTAINFHGTVSAARAWGQTSSDPTLRFAVFGAVNFTLASLIGSMMSLRSVSTATRFTDFVVAHEHHVLHAFLAMTLFGALYYILPRLTRRDWPSASLISAHFWLCVLGTIGYVVALSIHGIQQGAQWNATVMSPAEIAAAGLTWNVAGSISTALMTVGHLVFCGHVLWLLAPRAERRDNQPQLAR